MDNAWTAHRFVEGSNSDSPAFHWRAWLGMQPKRRKDGHAQRYAAAEAGMGAKRACSFAGAQHAQRVAMTWPKQCEPIHAQRGRLHEVRAHGCARRSTAMLRAAWTPARQRRQTSQHQR